MSANNPSDATPHEAPVATSATPAAPVVLDGFGSSRGTGLARGKRPARPASTAADSRDSGLAGYQPTSIQVVVTQTAYVNPFEPTPAPDAPVAESVSTPAPVASSPVSAPAPSQPEPAPAPALVEETAIAPEPAAPAPKPELNILPPAEPRPATSWESPGAAATGDRPVFRIERKPIVPREIEPLRPADNRSQGDSARPDARDGGRRRDSQGQGRRREGGDFRRDDRRDGARPSAPGANPAAPASAPRPASARPAPEKGGGFVGWLKGIFGGGQEAPSSTGNSPRGEREPRGDGQHGRRRRRGGQGRSQGAPGLQPGAETRGPRPEGGQQPRPDNPRGDGQGRRRQRGGRGRGPRPDGPGPRSTDSGPAPTA